LLQLATSTPPAGQLGGGFTPNASLLAELLAPFKSNVVGGGDGAGPMMGASPLAFDPLMLNFDDGMPTGAFGNVDNGSGSGSGGSSVSANGFYRGFHLPGFSGLNSSGVTPCTAAIAQAAGSLVSGTVAPMQTEKSVNMVLPSDFYLPEFQEYGRHHYEMSANSDLRKRLRLQDGDESMLSLEDETDQIKAAEMRRQIHIQSEQKRRAQIKDGFEELRRHLPNCVNKKISKAAILSKTTLYLQQLKQSHFALATEVERLQEENARLKQFQEQVLQQQKQSLKMYSGGVNGVSNV